MAIEFGSPEAAKVLENNKRAEIEAVLDTIDWDGVEDNAEVKSSHYEAKTELIFRGKTFKGDGDSSISEQSAVRQALEDIRWQVKMALKNGKIPLG